jgi:hypothetical protein
VERGTPSSTPSATETIEPIGVTRSSMLAVAGSPTTSVTPTRPIAPGTSSHGSAPSGAEK